jgi:hypothetical protein
MTHDRPDVVLARRPRARLPRRGVGVARASASASRGEGVGFVAVGFVALAVACGALGSSAPARASERHGEHRRGIPASVRAALLARAQGLARRDGERDPYDIQVVKTTAAEASRIAGEGDRVIYSGPGPAVYLIAMRGRFTCDACSAPHGAKLPRGSVITLELPVTAGENFGSGFGVGDRYPDLAAAGTPIRLQGASTSSVSPETLIKDACDEPLLAGEPAPPCVPAIDGGVERTRLYLDDRRPSKVLVWASPQVENTGAPGVRVTVHYAIFLDGGPIVERSIALDGSQHARPSIDARASIPAGRHTLGFEAFGASFSSREPGEAIVAPVSLVALAIP